MEKFPKIVLVTASFMYLFVLGHPVFQIKRGNSDNLGKKIFIQSTLVISTSVISNHRLSPRENLVLVLTPKSKIRLQNIVERVEIAPGEQFLPFSTISSIYIYN